MLCTVLVAPLAELTVATAVFDEVHVQETKPEEVALLPSVIEPLRDSVTPSPSANVGLEAETEKELTIACPTEMIIVLVVEPRVAEMVVEP
jgi:hypothetical protein